mmetsp:Transcript_11272/g.22196  ORF Transcript_11272/g.22196 Transcript_11272/m.22196 type:complete len:106 (+) Transcript_11272:570-887(+)
MEWKEIYTDFVQKDIAKQCFLSCYTRSDTSCVSKCYENYLVALNTTTQVIKDVGKERHSRYIKLVFGDQRPEWENIIAFNDAPVDMIGNTRYYFERDYFDLERDR